MRLGDFIPANLEHIIREWQEHAQSINVAKHLSKEKLQNHIQQLLIAIAKDLASPQTDEESVKKSKGQGSSQAPYSDELDIVSQAHSLIRLDLGFSIEEMISEYRALRASVFRLWFIDLDRFKEVNDMLGHDAGDLLLRTAATRIRSCTRETDTVARLGGDEFTVILTDVGEPKRIQSVAEKILKELANPYYISAEMVTISGSIGITVFPQDAMTDEDLVRNADQTMYAAKNAGRNQYRFFASNMQTTVRARLRLINDLRRALPHRQFVVFYQPIIDLANGETHKAEALLRWRHPKHGLILPGEFIPLAEETGLINEIGNWVFQEAVSRSQEWSSLLHSLFQISINKSPVQFMSHRGGMDWCEYLTQQGLPSQCLSIEITEGVLLNALSGAAEQLAELHAAGVQLAIDDFGTGYSSMSYLNRFDVDFLKIDQSFVRDMLIDKNCRTIAETVIMLAHKLGMKAIAEGVENINQRNWLREAGCDYAQGYFYSEAIPEQQFAALLKTPGMRH